jgi:sugar phosphate permease
VLTLQSVAFILASATLSGAVSPSKSSTLVFSRRTRPRLTLFLQFGGAIAYGIGHLNGTAGLEGWRWLFIIEGIPSCLSAFLVLFFLPDYPEHATWLTEAEKDMAILRLYHEGSKENQPAITWEDVRGTLTDWRLYGHYIAYFAISPPFASLSLFSPSITIGLGYRDLEAQLMTVPPWAIAYGQ